MGRNYPSAWSKSFDILHSSLLFVVLACVIHVLYVDPPKYLRTLPFLLTFYRVLCIFLRTFIFSGIYGTIVELASQEQPAINRDSFFKNAKCYWKIYFILANIHLFANFFSAKLIISLNPTFPFESFFFDLLLIYFVAYLIIRNKYITTLRLPKRKIIVRPDHILTIFILFMIDALLINFRHFLPAGFHITNEPIAAYTYVHYFIFIYFVRIILDAYPEIEKAHDKDKEIYLVNPVTGGGLAGIVSQWLRNYPPVFVTLKALTPQGYNFKEFNRVPWKNRFFKGNKLVAITSFTSSSCEAYKIAKEFKKLGSKVIMGGAHVTYLPEEALQFCDTVVLGEGESVWQEIIRDYENNSLKRIYHGSPQEDFHSLVHNKLLSSPPSVIKDFLETTRGCKYHCHFCAIPFLTQGKIRKKPVEEIVELIQKIRPRRHQALLFLDNNIISDPEYAKRLFNALIPLKILWGSQCSLDIAEDDELLRLAKMSGCIQLLLGYEITAHSREKQRQGKFSLADRYLELTKKVKKAGIKIKAHFILGFESDNYYSMFQLWKYCFSLMPLFSAVSILTPLPGSQLFYQMLKEDRIINYDWRHYGLQSLVFKHNSFNTTLFNFLFLVFQFIFVLTACSFGIFVIIIILLDIRFQFEVVIILLLLLGLDKKI